MSGLGPITLLAAAGLGPRLACRAARLLPFAAGRGPLHAAGAAAARLGRLLQEGDAGRFGLLLGQLPERFLLLLAHGAPLLPSLGGHLGHFALRVLEIAGQEVVEEGVLGFGLPLALFL